MVYLPDETLKANDAGATRNLAAAMIEKTRDVICYGMEQGEDARYHSKQVGRDAQISASFPAILCLMVMLEQGQ